MMLGAFSLKAQTQGTPIAKCGFDYFIQDIRQSQPEYYNSFANLFHASKGTLHTGNRSGEVLVVPVVFHIIYNTESQNLSDSVIFSQIEVLNEDYRRQNADAIETRDIFLPVAEDTEIEFRLATIDPDGNPTTGITRTQTSRTGFSMDLFSQVNTLDEVKNPTSGGVSAWDASRYLNIWVCKINSSFFGQVYGMAYPPAGLVNWPEGSAAPTLNEEGVIVHYTCVGRNNPVAGDDNDVENDLGRTLTHEIGHYLGLRHIWGDVLFGNGCTEDDGIEDTPNCSTADQYACNHNANTCETDQPGDLPDMIENYMDYTKEQCYNLFTQGQKEHMRYVLTELRPGLLTGEVLGMSNTIPEKVELMLWPIPATQYIHIKTDRGNRGSYSIVNLLGEIVGSGEIQHGTVSIDHLNPGVYFFSFNFRNQYATKRFVVQ